MDGPSPRNLAFLTAILVSLLFSALLGAADHYFFGGMNGMRLFAMGTVLAIITFVVVHYVLIDFIYEKVKVVYRTISLVKNPTKDLKERISDERDILGSVNQQVLTWAEERNREVQDLRDMELYRREFLGNISHELKTPIFNIQGYLHTLLDGGLEDPEVNRKYLKRADRSVERMISLVEDLDLISKLESGRLSLNQQRFNVVELVREVIDMQEQKADRRKVRIRLNKKYERPIMVMADPDRIRQVYINLIDNAIKYGSAEGTIELRFYDMEPNVLCEVADDGPGIEAEHLPRLFERFYRTDKARAREQGGSGLGLSIVKHIIEAHGQGINVRSQTGEGSGTTFAFTLALAGG